MPADVRDRARTPAPDNSWADTALDDLADGPARAIAASRATSSAVWSPRASTTASGSGRPSRASASARRCWRRPLGRCGRPATVADKVREAQRPETTEHIINEIRRVRPDAEVPVAYVPGLAMRSAVDLYPAAAETGRRAAFELADTARLRRH